MDFAKNVRDVIVSPLTRHPLYYDETLEAMSDIVGTSMSNIVASGIWTSSLYDADTGKDFTKRSDTEFGLEDIQVKLRKIKIGAKDLVTVNSMVTSVNKALVQGNSLVKTITAHVSPRKENDLVLGLPWLKKHNDPTSSYSIPRMPAPRIPVDPVDPVEEFHTFLERDDEPICAACILLPAVDLASDDDSTPTRLQNPSSSAEPQVSMMIMPCK